MVDYKSLVEQADLYTCGLTQERYQGMPLGNGVTGSMVWIDEQKIGMQINRVDVFATNSATTAANWDMDAPDYCGVNEYCSGCAGVSIDFGENVFTEMTQQKLQMYGAELTLSEKDFEAKMLVWSDADAFVWKITDKREMRSSVSMKLTMLREAVVKRKAHMAVSSVGEQDDRICLMQEFSEKCSTGISENDHYCASCVTAGGKGVRITNITVEEQHHIVMTMEPQAESYYLILSSGASFDSMEKACADAEQAWQLASKTGWDEIRESHTKWWHKYWAKSFIDIPKYLDFTKAWYTYYYYIGSTMRGDYPAKFNGLIFSTEGDVRFWGGQYWWYNQSRSHYGLSAANHGDCNKPLFGMLLRNREKYEIACEQQFGGNGGIYLPETDAFSGPEILPDEIASDLKASLLFDKPATRRLLDFMADRSGLNSRWADFYSGETQKTEDILHFRWHSNLSYDAGDAANSMLEYYQYMDDEEILKEIYPWLRGVAEFYRHYPGGRIEEDGLYHIEHLGWAESITWAKDVIDDITIMKGIYPTVIAVSEKLGVDEELRREWEKMLPVLPPYPTSDMEDAIACKPSPDGLTTYAIARKPCNQMSDGNPNDCRLRMTFSYDLMNLETKKSHPEEWEIANRSLDNLPVIRLLKQGIPALNDEKIGYAFNRVLVKAAMLGRRDLIRECLPWTLRAFKEELPCPGGEKHFPNMLPMTNGAGGQSIQELGTFCDQLQAPLLQSLADGPGKFEHVIHVVPAWPMEWDVSFELRAKGAFLVAVKVQEELLEFVRITSEKGNRCLLHNPWQGERVMLKDKDGNECILQGETLVFETEAEGIYYLKRCV